MPAEKFDWATHVGQQTPEEFRAYARQRAQGLPVAIRAYLGAVRRGSVFGEPVDLDASAEADMLAYIKANTKDLPRGAKPGKRRRLASVKASVRVWVYPETAKRLAAIAERDGATLAETIDRAVQRLES